MKHSIPHDLSMELARKATRRAFQSYAERFSDFKPTADWVDENTARISFSAKGLTLNGGIELKPTEALLDLDVPFVMRPFKKKALKVIEEEMRDWITRAKNGELDGDEEE